MAPVRRDARGIGDPVAPRPIGRQAHPHPGSGCDVVGGRHRASVDDDAGRYPQVGASIGHRDTQRPGQITRPSGENPIGDRSAPDAGGVVRLDDLPGSQQYCASVTLLAGDDVGAMVPVNAVHVQPIGWTVHELRPRCATEGVRGRIAGAVVGLHLGDPRDDAVVPNDHRTEECACLGADVRLINHGEDQ